MSYIKINSKIDCKIKYKTTTFLVKKNFKTGNYLQGLGLGKELDLTLNT